MGSECFGKAEQSVIETYRGGDGTRERVLRQYRFRIGWLTSDFILQW